LDIRDQRGFDPCGKSAPRAKDLEVRPQSVERVTGDLELGEIGLGAAGQGRAVALDLGVKEIGVAPRDGAGWLGTNGAHAACCITASM
jgi:hypothetical protein